MKIRKAGVAFLVMIVCSFLSTSLYAQSDSTGLKGPFKLEDPPNIKTTYKYDPTTGDYLEIITIGGRTIGSPRVLTIKEYIKAKERQDREIYYRKKSNADNYVKGGGIIPTIAVAPEIFDKVFGGGVIDIRPTGSAEVTFGGNFNKIENPAFPVRQQRNGQFDFGMKMQLNVTGQIGDRLKLNWNYDTEATFEFENQMKLAWQGGEDDIVKNIELGNVSLPLNGSLIQGGRNLFGAKTQLQFGKLKVALIATQDKGETRETEVTGGAQVTNYDIQGHDYDANRHYFLSETFANNYDDALSQLPIIRSAIQINLVEVWVTNRSNSVGNTRNVMGYMDLGEVEGSTFRDFLVGNGTQFPNNTATNFYNDIARNVTTFCDVPDPRMELGTDYECLSNARKLNDNEFTFHPNLGYISLNQSLNNDEVLMVAYEYTANGARFQVGELTRDNQRTSGSGSFLNLKLLKHSSIKTNLPTWDLMMKNIYSLNTYNLQQQDFTLNVVYADDPSGADLNYLPVEANEPEIREKQLITVLNLDKINKQQEAKPDGVFDLIEGVTIQAARGRIIFPVREPFGEFLREKFQDEKSADYYAFDSLYSTTKWNAEQDLKHNKYFLRGTFKGSSSDQIRLQCYNISPGSVRVTANGAVLNEGSDYDVDYAIGTVRILNQGILNSGASIKATCESNSLINIQQRTLVGTRLDYKFSDKLLLGGTFMHMSEQPLTNKVNIGEEPLRNSIWGLDGSYNTDSRFLTRMVDKIPFVETKEKSSISITGEFAHLIPHKAKTQGDRGTSYLDDFEGAETPYDLKFVRSWHMASVPLGQPDLFPETVNGGLVDSAYNSKRANLAWYNLDPVFQATDRNLTPSNIGPIDQSDHWVRTVLQREIFQDLQLQQGQPQQLATLDLSFYPDERGQYNFNTQNLLEDGTLENPKENWGGIMRRIETNDFEATNIDYIEIWMLDPFTYSKYNGTKHSTGELYINLGSVSEDVIPDRRRSAENGLPTDGGNNTAEEGNFAYTPNGQIINKAFDNAASAREAQDVGLDGMNDELEREKLAGYLRAIENKHGQASLAYQLALNDPSGDNYLYPRDPIYDGADAKILERYKRFNGFEGNSTLDKLDDGTPKSANTIPDDEDVNQDYTVNLNEEYYQYKIDISPGALKIGQNFVTDSVVADANQLDPGVLPNQVVWYQLKIPIRQFEKQVGGIEGFKSIRFMRMFLKGFEDSVVLRFGNLQLVRADWRRYLNTLKFPPRVGPAIDPNDDSELVISTVNVNENSRRSPIPYVVPPGFQREIDPTQVGNVEQNEQSLSIAVCDLPKEDARGGYRPMDFDIRNYKRLKMAIHAESELAQNGDVVAIMRIGTDLENNFYQYEIPLTLTVPGSADPQAVWPEVNELDIELEQFYQLKLRRQLNNSGNPNGYYSETLDNGHKISMIGLPDLSNVRTVLLGVKNAGTSSQERLCAEVWFNELRLVDFANRGGYAANARMVAKLADFANVTVSGNYQSIGFGAIDKKLNERNLNEQIQYDIASNINLGKFFPQKSGIAVPMFIGYSENIINPKFYPLNPDIELRTAINNAETQTERDQIRRAAQDYTSRYSLNFTNVKKNRTAGSGTPRFYDIENWNYSFAYQRIFRRSQVIEMNDAKTYKSVLGYNFSPKPKYWEPFRKTVKSKSLRLIKDFNIGLKPSNLNFRVDVDRRYGELKNRDNDNFRSIVPILYDKTFSINRVYGMQWKLTRSLSVDYAATANSWVEEPFGELNTPEKRDSMWSNFWELGRMNTFNQTVNANYSVPTRKIRLLNWTTITTRYSGNYQWRNAPPASPGLGNTIQNARTIGVNGNFNFVSLYNKVPFLKKVNRRTPPRRPSRDEDEEDEDKKREGMSEGTKGLIRMLMLVKQAQIGITKTDGTTLPGFTKEINAIGQNFANNAPGLPFIFGGQNENFRQQIAANGFLTDDPNQIARYISLDGLDINGSATLEPFKGFRISLKFNKRQSLNVNSNFAYSPETQGFEDLFYTETGMFTTSFGTWNTMFDQLDTNDFSSPAFDQFKSNRFTIAQRLQAREFGEGGAYEELYANRLGDVDTSGFPVGFNNKHPEVLLHSFIAAYSGQNASTQELTPFKRIPIPNWRFTYNGLSKLDIFKDFFSNISISHGYSSILNIGAFQQPINYGTDETLLVGGDSGNLTPSYQFINGVSIIERLTPLVGLDITTKEGITLGFEYKQDRNLQLNVETVRMVEQRNKEIVIRGGFRTTGLRLPVKFQGKRIILQNDLNIRFDFSIRDGITIVRTLEANGGDDSYIPTAGIRTMSIRPSIDYKISEALNFRMFYNRNSNTPVVSNSFPSALTDFGVTLRYTMQ